MEIILNGERTIIPQGTTLLSLRDARFPQADICILRGYETEEDRPLSEGDPVTFIRRGKMPSQKELESMMAARHTPTVHERVKKATVGVAGLGGLGSHIGVMLARTGVGRLILADFDRVEPSNLNRQHYLIRHLGMFKAEALAQQLKEINPFLQVEPHFICITEQNAVPLFSQCDVVCEALDRPEAKAMLTSTLLKELPYCKVVAASGMAGYGSANKILTHRTLKNLYLCGDLQSEAKEGQGLMAPRVLICAGHQANMALRLLLGEEEP